VVQVHGDRIGQVLSNLLSNALKYAPACRPVVLSLSTVENVIGNGSIFGFALPVLPSAGLAAVSSAHWALLVTRLGSQNAVCCTCPL
jgi:signal transduction histidine kinase